MEGEDGKEQVTWRERPRPEVEKLMRKIGPQANGPENLSRGVGGHEGV